MVVPAASSSVSPAVAELAAVVDRLAGHGVAVDRSEILEVRHQIDRLRAIVGEAEIRFDEAGLWRDEGASSMTAWLMSDGAMSRRDASRDARRSDRLASWPAVASAWRSGAVSVAQIDAMVSIVPARFVGRFAECADDVLRVVAPLDVRSTELALRQWVRVAEADDGPSDLVERSSGLYASSLMDDAFALNGLLYGADAAIVSSALRVFDLPEPVDERGEPLVPTRTLARRTADALVAMARCALDHRKGPGENGRFLPHVSLVVDVVEARASALRGAGVRTLADLERVAERNGWSAVERAWFTEALAHHGDGVTVDGLVLDAAAISSLSCESVVHRVMTASSEVLDVGRDERTATRDQRRAIIARDRHCRAPGCRTRPRFCEVHHVDHWLFGGRTDVRRMVLLCGTHHREFHKDGYRLELDADARFTVHAPRGWTRSTVPERVEELRFPVPVR